MDENELINLSKNNKILSDKINNLERIIDSHQTLLQYLLLDYELKPKRVL